MTVAASRGVTGGTGPARTSRGRSAHGGGSRIAGRPGGSVMGRGGGVGASRARGGGVEASRARGGGAGTSSDLYDQLDLDRRVERQHRRGDRAAGVPARLAEHL